MPLPAVDTYALPLSESTLTAFLEAGTLPVSALEQAGLFAAALCQQRPHRAAELTRLLEQACALFAAHPDDAAAQFATVRAALPATVEGWLQAMAAQGVVLAAETVVHAYVLRASEHYAAEDFQRDSLVTLEAHTIHWYPDAPEDETASDVDASLASPAYIARTADYTPEQARALRAIVANDDEHIDLDAYAGAGKTHLILQLLDGAARRYTYIAPRASQVQAFRARLGAHLPVQIISQIGFANQIAAHAFQRGLLGSAYKPAFQISRQSFRDIAARIGLQGIGAYPPAAALRIALDGIATWCRSIAPRLEPRHFVRSVPHAMIDGAPYVAAAEHVWRCMFDPKIQKDAVLSLNVDHLGKWLALHDAPIPDSAGTLLIDEAHDLSPAWKALLARYTGSVISLGDPNQRLVGHAPRFATGMKLEIAQSVRQGRLVERLVNDTLALDSTALFEAPFSGATEQPTVTSIYRDWSEVPPTATRVFGSAWRLLEEAQRLSAAGAPLGIHPDTLRSLDREVTRGAEAYRELTAHGGSSRGWEALLAACEEQQVGQIPRMFMRGYNRDHFIELGQRLQPFTEATLQLVLVEHTKNSEYAQVAMATCCFRTGFARAYAHNPVRAAYTAMTRATRQLWLPEGALEALAESQNRYRARQEAQRRGRMARPRPLG
ncbi:hypothetical protein [Stenotrophomonas sp.]|uniref:hypothetical protein n=1 Tax=Stenotrophomonas sp. TaxID=69392 RepID=UPI002FCC00B8